MINSISKHKHTLFIYSFLLFIIFFLFSSAFAATTQDSVAEDGDFGQSVGATILIGTGGYQAYEASASYSWMNYYPRGPIASYSTIAICLFGPGGISQCSSHNFPTPNYGSSESYTYGLALGEPAAYDTAAFSGTYNTPYGGTVSDECPILCGDVITHYDFLARGRKVTSSLNAPDTAQTNSNFNINWSTEEAISINLNVSGSGSCSPSGNVTGVTSSTCTAGGSAGTMNISISATGPGSPNPAVSSKSISVTSVAPPPPPAPSFISFTATPSSVNSGDSTTLKWETEYFDSCTASNAWSDGKATTNLSPGEVQNNITTSKNYTLTCTQNVTGITIARTVPVTLNAVLNVNSVNVSGVVITRVSGTASTGGSTNYTFSSVSNISTVLQAPATSGAGTFSSWSGCDSVGGTGNRDCTVTVSTGATKSITVTYTGGSVVSGVCGTANKNYASGATSYGTDTFCSAGNASPSSPAFPVVGGSTNWSCLGLNGGSPAACTATRSSAGVNGSCGTRNTTYSAATSAWPGGSTYCATGTASISPAFPAAGSTANWSCLGSGGGTNSPQCAAIHLSSGFNLTVTANPGPGGTISSFDSLISNCNSTCVVTYPTGSSVTLQATPSSSYWQFNGWSGSCSGLGLCILTIDSDKSVTALFGPRDFDYGEF